MATSANTRPFANGMFVETKLEVKIILFHLYFIEQVHLKFVFKKGIPT